MYIIVSIRRIKHCWWIHFISFLCDTTRYSNIAINFGINFEIQLNLAMLNLSLECIGMYVWLQVKSLKIIWLLCLLCGHLLLLHHLLLLLWHHTTLSLLHRPPSIHLVYFFVVSWLLITLHLEILLRTPLITLKLLPILLLVALERLRWLLSSLLLLSISLSCSMLTIWRALFLSH